jgi:hypothetical protein
MLHLGERQTRLRDHEPPRSTLVEGARAGDVAAGGIDAPAGGGVTCAAALRAPLASAAIAAGQRDGDRETMARHARRAGRAGGAARGRRDGRHHGGRLQET